MKYLIPVCLLFLLGCFPGPRKIDHNKEWEKWSSDLKNLVSQIELNYKKYSIGNNDFPPEFSYPFDDGYRIHHYGNGTEEPIKPDSLTIIFYTDRGLMDHFSAFVYTNDPKQIKIYDDKIKNSGDYKMEKSWYYIKE